MLPGGCALTEESKAAAEKWVLRAGALAVALVAISSAFAWPGRWAASALVVPVAHAEAVEVVAPVKADVETLKRDVLQIKLETARTSGNVDTLLRYQGLRPLPPVVVPPMDGGP